MPALVYFEKQEPLLYTGDLTDEDEVLEWLKEQSVVEEEIEDVSQDALDEIIKTGKSIAVIICKMKFMKLNSPLSWCWFSDDSNNKKAAKVLDLLEDIDDELKEIGIEFVKIDDAEEFSKNDNQPKLLFYNKGIPQVFEGALTNKQEILEWVQNESSSEEIEDITDEMLDDIIDTMKHVAVLFCK